MTEIATFPTPEQEEQDQYGVNDAVRLLVNSFRFSQGETVLQEQILEQVGYLTYGKLSPEVVEASIEPTIQAVKKIVMPDSRTGPKKHVAIADHLLTESQVREYAHYLSMRIRPGQPSAHTITTGLIDRDYKFLISRGGRDRDESDRVRPSNDRFLSHFVYFGLMGQSTGSAEYDQIFAMAVSDLENDESQKTELNRARLSQVIQVYMSQHPEQIMLLPEPYRRLAEAA